MNEEIFNEISNQLGKCGVSVSANDGGSIMVTLPDSNENLAECKDNGDGTVSYVLHLGDGHDENGTGTVSDFTSQAIKAIDSWIELTPYDKFAAMSPDGYSCVAESREDAMRNSLFEMGLGKGQADAIMDVVNILFEASNMVHVKVAGRDLTGNSLSEIASSKANRPFLERQWMLRELRNSKALDANDKMAGLSDLKAKLGSIGKQPPTADDLYSFVKENAGTMQLEQLPSDNDVLGTAWSQFDTKKKPTGKVNASTSVLNNETPIESGEADDYDEELGHQGARGGDITKDDIKSEDSLNDAMGIDLSWKESGPDASTAEAGNGLATAGTGDIESKWTGDASELGVNAIGRNYDLPVRAIAQVENKAMEMKESVNDILEEIPSIKSRPVSIVLQLMFGKAGGSGVRGAVSRLINGDQSVLKKIEAGDGIIDADVVTPAMRKELEAAISTEEVQDKIARVQDGFAEYADFIVGILPEAYDEACGVESGSPQSAGGSVDAVEPDFVDLFRSILFDKKLPFGGYPWDVVDILCTDLGSVMKLRIPEGHPRIRTAAPVTKKPQAA